MLRSTINLNEGVDISKFPTVIPYLKRKGEQYTPKKSTILSKENVDNFLTGADNKEHLLNKVILIFGIAGACRRQELASLTTSCVEDHQTHFCLTRRQKNRSFIIVPGEAENLNLLEISRKYMQLRPAKIPHNRFFVNYVREKCTVQPVEVHKIAGVPSVVAKYLNLENSSLYTGHCFRRTSASMLANTGASMENIMRHGRWRSSTVAAGYIEDSHNTKFNVAIKILGECSTGGNNNKDIQDSLAQNMSPDLNIGDKILGEECFSNKKNLSSGLNIRDNTNCVINIHYHNK